MAKFRRGPFFLTQTLYVKESDFHIPIQFRTVWIPQDLTAYFFRHFQVRVKEGSWQIRSVFSISYSWSFHKIFVLSFFNFYSQLVKSTFSSFQFNDYFCVSFYRLHPKALLYLLVLTFINQFGFKRQSWHWWWSNKALFRNSEWRVHQFGFNY